MTSVRTSILIPAYNAGPYLRDAVASALGQSESDLEVLLIDDGSTDGSVQALAATTTDPRLRILRQENRGKSHTMNRAFQEAQGAYFALQDADDISLPERTKRQAAYLDDHPQTAIAFTGYSLILHGEVLAPRFRGKSSEECRADIDAFRQPSHDPTMMIRAEVARSFPLDPALPIAHSYDQILRVGETHSLALLPHCLYQYRITPGSLTHSDPLRIPRDVLRVLGEAHARRGRPFDEDATWARLTRHTHSNRGRDNNLAAHFMESVLDLKHAGRWGESFRVALACLRLHPLDLYYWRPLLYLATPTKLLQRLRKQPESVTE